MATNQRGKNQFLKNPVIFWQLAGTYYLNTAILERKKNTIPVTTLVHFLLCSQNSFVWVALSFFFWSLEVVENSPKTMRNIEGEQLGLKKGFNSMYFVIFHQPVGAVVDQSSSWVLSQKAIRSPILPLLFIQWREVANRKDLGLAANVECHNQRSWSSCWDSSHQRREDN